MDDHRLEPQILFLLVLLLLTLGCVAYGVADIVRELDFRLLLTIATLGVLVGWMMVTIRLSAWLAGILAPSLGVVVVLVRVGRLEGKVATLAWALTGPIREIRPWPLGAGWRGENGIWKLVSPPLSWMAVLQPLTELWADTSVLLHRGLEWILGLVAGKPTFDRWRQHCCGVWRCGQ